jgi:hypothetical protein
MISSLTINFLILRPIVKNIQFFKNDVFFDFFQELGMFLITSILYWYVLVFNIF